MRETFTFKDSIKNIGSKSAKEKKYFKKFIQIRQKIIKNLDTVKDTFHVLSEKFKLSFLIFKCSETNAKIQILKGYILIKLKDSF